MEAIRTIIAESLPTLWLRSARRWVPAQWIIDRIADEQMYNAVCTATCTPFVKMVRTRRKKPAALLESERPCERGASAAFGEAQRGVLKRLRNERIIDTNVLHAIQEILDIEEVRVLGPVELE